MLAIPGPDFDSNIGVFRPGHTRAYPVKLIQEKKWLLGGFSSICWLKKYLLSTMTQQRPNSLALLYIEIDLLSTLWICFENFVLQF